MNNRQFNEPPQEDPEVRFHPGDKVTIQTTRFDVFSKVPYAHLENRVLTIKSYKYDDAYSHGYRHIYYNTNEYPSEFWPGSAFRPKQSR